MQGVLPVFDRKLAHLTKTRGRGVVVENIDAPVLGHSGLDPGPGLLVIAQVHGGIAMQGMPLGAHQGAGLLMALGVEVAADHNRSFAGKTQRCRTALATTGTGNQSHLVQ